MKAAPSSRPDRPIRPWNRLEQGLSVAILGFMVVLPVVGVLSRWIFNLGLGGLNLVVQSLNLWLAFIGAAMAAWAHRHLALSTTSLLELSGRARWWIAAFTSAVATAVTALLAWASVQLVLAERGSALALPGGIPMWAVQCIMPVGFGIAAIRLAWWGNPDWRGRLVALVMVGLAMALALVPEGERAWIVWAGSGVVLLAVVLGAPIFTAMGGLAMLLFFGQPMPVPITAVPAATFRIVASPTLPTIPLFTLAGYLLAEGGASHRLVGLFRAWVGWIPGGTAAAAVLVCAFFTTFTGASGVTILALGGLLFPVLVKAGYSERFTIGLLAAAGSIGLLFPPSLPVILYGVVSHVAIDDLYVAGAAPGFLLVALLAGFGVFKALRSDLEREPFDPRAALSALWNAKWEALLPVLVLLGIFGGWMTIFEAAAWTAAYAFVVEVLIHRDLHWRRDIPGVFVECATLMGGVLIILGVALGFTSYLVDAQIPMKLASWTEAHVANKLLFILLLNVFLLAVGCLMEIYSAIMVVVPLIVPIGAAFGIDPLHLGILFLANLELGYLTPPVGMNLFLASYRFEKPLTSIYRMALPFLAILAVGVLMVAYVPIFTTWPRHFESAGPEVEWDETDPTDLPTGAAIQEELQDTEPSAGDGSQGLQIPEGADLLQELDAEMQDETEGAEAPEASGGIEAGGEANDRAGEPPEADPAEGE